jgi:hypothetical protein
LELMLRAAAVALEGGRRRADDAATPIRAAVPLHACRMLDRLMGRPRPYGVIDELRADLTATRDRPTEIALAHRALHLGTLGVLLLLGLLFTFAPTYIELADLVIDAAFPRQASLGPESRRNLAIRAACIVPALWVAWSFVTRGGLSLSMLGLAVVRRDGKQASRWRCGWRALVMWAPLAALLVAAVWTKHAVPRPYWLPWVIYGSAIALLVSYLPAALLMPSRGLHDRLAGTCLVPK